MKRWNDTAVTQSARQIESTLISIPVAATYRIINGEAVLIKAEYADIPAGLIARFLIEGFHRGDLTLKMQV